MLTRRELVLGGVAAALEGLSGCGVEARPGSEPTHGPYDLCVVGSGFAGLPLALRTVQKGLATAIVDAGAHPGQDLGGLSDAFVLTTSGVASYPADGCRMIAVGGTSNRWAGNVNRLRPTDFRVRSEFGMDADWPIAYDDLEAYYCEAERMLSATGAPPVPGAEPPRSCEYPHRLDDRHRMPFVSFEGKTLPLFAVPKSRRGGTAGTVRLTQWEIPQFLASPHAALLTRRQAIDLVTRDGKRIDHLVVRSADGREEHVRARCFVVAAGVVESARLLLRSRSRWFSNGLGNDHDLVGRFLADHPTYTCRIRISKRAGATEGIHRTYEFNDRLRARRLNACHYQLHVDGSEWVTWKAQPEMEPRPQNRVTLSVSKRDRSGELQTHVHLDLSDRDRRTAREAMAFLRAQVRASGAGPGDVQDGVGVGWRCHPSGTCRMSVDETSGVVDRDGRVFGLDNLYVSGAMVFPTAGTSNPTLTVVAMTLRLADHLIGRLSRG